jgi:hypothetical protein
MTVQDWPKSRVSSDETSCLDTDMSVSPEISGTFRKQDVYGHLDADQVNRVARETSERTSRRESEESAGEQTHISGGAVCRGRYSTLVEHMILPERRGLTKTSSSCSALSKTSAETIPRTRRILGPFISKRGNYCLMRTSSYTSKLDP